MAQNTGTRRPPFGRTYAFLSQSKADDFGSEVKVRWLFYSAIIHFNAAVGLGHSGFALYLTIHIIIIYRPYGFNCLRVQRTDFELNIHIPTLLLYTLYAHVKLLVIYWWK